MADEIDKFMRDYNRYTGDGLPNEPVGHPLPIGDPESGAYYPTKADMREWAGAIEAGASSGDSLLSVADARANYAIHATVDASSTSSNIVLTGPELKLFPDTGTVIIFEADRDFSRLVDAGSAFNDTITIQTKDSDGGMGGRFVARTFTNGSASDGMITNRQTYQLQFFGNMYRISGYGDVGFQKATTGVLIASAVGGTVDEIEVTVDYQRVAGSLLVFEAAGANTTSTPTLSTIDQFGAQTASTEIRKSDNTPVSVGEWGAGDLVTVFFYSGTGGNPWRLLNVTSKGDMTTLQDRITDAEANIAAILASSAGVTFSVEAATLSDKINGPNVTSSDWETALQNVDHTDAATTGTTRRSFTEGVLSVEAPAVLTILGFGSSIDESGAGSADAATFTPSIMLRDNLRNRFSLYRNLDFTQSNVAVGGQFINQFLAQLQTAASPEYDIVVGGNPMNAGAIFGTASGATMRTFAERLEEVVDYIRTDLGAVPILTNTFHPHIHFDTSGNTPAEQFTDSARVAWPRGNQTYQVTATHIFDSAANTIQLIAINSFGSTLAAGDTLTVESGSAAGTYTIASIDWSTNIVTVNEPVTFTGSYVGRVTNTSADEERVVFPPASERIQRLDRTGRGIAELPGFVTYDETNRIYEDVGTAKECIIADFEYAQFRFLEDKWQANNSISDSDLYDSMYLQGGIRQANHPNAEFYAFAYGGTWSTLSSHIRRRTLASNRVIRMGA